MIKRIDVPVPSYLKKFIEREYCQFLNQDGVLSCDKRMFLGKLIHFSLRVDPYPKKMEIPKNATVLKLSYYDRKYSTYFPSQQVTEFVELLKEMFRDALINYVRSVHRFSNAPDYTIHIHAFLQHYGIDEEDIDFQTARKIYRDYLRKIRKNFDKSFVEKSTVSYAK